MTKNLQADVPKVLRKILSYLRQRRFKAKMFLCMNLNRASISQFSVIKFLLYDLMLIVALDLFCCKMCATCKLHFDLFFIFHLNLFHNPPKEKEEGNLNSAFLNQAIKTILKRSHINFFRLKQIR